jgi:hypothetical protein
MCPAKSLRSVTHRSEVLNRAKHGSGELIFFSLELASRGAPSFLNGLQKRVSCISLIVLFTNFRALQRRCNYGPPA